MSATQIFYDPDPQHTLIKDDEQILISYNDIVQEENVSGNDKFPPWLMRFEFDAERVNTRHLTMAKIANKIYEAFQDQMNEMHSDDNDDKLIMRIRVKDI